LNEEECSAYCVAHIFLYESNYSNLATTNVTTSIVRHSWRFVDYIIVRSKCESDLWPGFTKRLRGSLDLASLLVAKLDQQRRFQQWEFVAVGTHCAE
jgi:hypothetical protein